MVISAVIMSIYDKPQGLMNDYVETEEKTVQRQYRQAITIPSLWFSLAPLSHLALLSKVFSEFFQFLQILIIDCWLCASQRPQHVRLKRKNEVLW